MKTLPLLLLCLLPLQDSDDERIRKLADGLVTDGDEGLFLFRDAIRSPIGGIVLQDRISRHEAQLRAAYVAKAIPNFFAKKEQPLSFRPSAPPMI